MKGTEKYTKVEAVDEKEYNAHHHYEVQNAENQELLNSIYFQKGPIKECGVNGCHNEDLIVIVIDRLEGFQNSPYACHENFVAIEKLKEALSYLRDRTNNRIARNVEGTHVI